MTYHDRSILKGMSLKEVSLEVEQCELKGCPLKSTSVHVRVCETLHYTRSEYVRCNDRHLIWFKVQSSSFSPFKPESVTRSDSREPLHDPKMVGKSDRFYGEVSDVESRYEPPKKGLKDDPIVLSDSEEVNQEYELEFDTKLQSIKKKLKGDLEDMNFEMSYVRVNKKDYQDSNNNEDEDPETPPHYHSDEFYDGSLNEE
ncbi:hypothetical protein FNV43_RR11076 [Rhamnella rubrinervis]|uniref:Uncharacterized protein n=1 Tax=Rhamnella rubrinervis TaxID=2594499 RepID=A0A8K0H5B2_9ROSA|nr:hypothetical protein FNV43_RR11076 [Rhamnella rubrinervis]